MGLTFLSSSPSQSAAEMENIINNYGISSDYTLYNVYEMFEQNRNIIFIVNLFTYVFILMISLIAVANVFKHNFHQYQAAEKGACNASLCGYVGP